jgi:hypothetical protein
MCLRARDTVFVRRPLEIAHMDPRGRALGNVFVERLLCSVNDEEVAPNSYASVTDVLQGLGLYFGFCNQACPQQALGSRLPAANARPGGQPELSGGRFGLFEALRACGQTWIGSRRPVRRRHET